MATPYLDELEFDEQEEEEEPIMLVQRPGVCRVCGCTPSRPCVDANGNGCHWVTPTLCSGCVEP